MKKNDQKMNTLLRLVLVFLFSYLLPAGWREAAAQPPPVEPGPKACLHRLEPTADVSGDPRLGRVLWDGKIMEPVLVRSNNEGETGHHFRNCSGMPTEIVVGKSDLFNSALVARFAQETETLRKYREVPGLGEYEEIGEVKHTFRGAGSMLEAKRRRNGHVKVTIASGANEDDYEYLTLAISSKAFQVANAIFQDQALGMVETVNFLECLLDDAHEAREDLGIAHEARSGEVVEARQARLENLGRYRIEILKEGLKQIGIPTKRLEEMNVRQMFQYLFQGFSLPEDLQAGNREFLNSIKHGNPRLLDVVRSLRKHFDNTSLRPDRVCEVVLVPDEFLFDQSDEAFAIVRSIPGPRKIERPKPKRQFSFPSLPPITLGIKTWNASLSADNLDGGSGLFHGLIFSMGRRRLWASLGYVEGDVDFTTEFLSGSIEEVDSDIIVGWSFARLDVGVGYRHAEFTTKTGNVTISTTSSGPMVLLGGGDHFGQSRLGYYWSASYMFEDMDDDDGAQEHVSGEGGVRWTSRGNLSILAGYRYKGYSGDSIAGLTFAGPVVNLSYTWR